MDFECEDWDIGREASGLVSSLFQDTKASLISFVREDLIFFSQSQKMYEHTSNYNYAIYDKN